MYSVGYCDQFFSLRAKVRQFRDDKPIYTAGGITEAGKMYCFEKYKDVAHDVYMINFYGDQDLSVTAYTSICDASLCIVIDDCVNEEDNYLLPLLVPIIWDALVTDVWHIAVDGLSLCAYRLFNKVANYFPFIERKDKDPGVYAFDLALGEIIDLPGDELLEGKPGKWYLKNEYAYLYVLRKLKELHYGSKPLADVGDGVIQMVGICAGELYWIKKNPVAGAVSYYHFFLDNRGSYLSALCNSEADTHNREQFVVGAVVSRWNDIYTTSIPKEVYVHTFFAHLLWNGGRDLDADQIIFTEPDHNYTQAYRSFGFRMNSLRIRPVVLLLLLLFTSLAGTAQIRRTIDEKTDLLSHLVNPTWRGRGMRAEVAAHPLKADYVFYYYSDEWLRNRDSSRAIFTDMLHVAWNYIFKDATSEFDSIRVRVADTVTAFIPMSCAMASNQSNSKPSFDERVAMLHRILYIPNVINIIPTDKKGIYTVEVFLWSEACALGSDIERLKIYVTVLSNIMGEFVIAKEYNKYTQFIVRLFTKENILIERFIYDTREIAKELGL